MRNLGGKIFLALSLYKDKGIKKQRIMKNSVIATLVIALMISTSAFGQRDARKVKSTDSKTTRVQTRNTNSRAVKTSNRTTTRNNGYYKRPNQSVRTQKVRGNRNVSVNRNVRANRNVRVNRKVRNLSRSNRVQHRGVSYYYNSNRFYQQRNGFYHVVAAPFGYRVNVIQTGCYTFRRGNIAYYYSGGSFYNYNNAGYYTVAAPPQGAMVYQLPFGTQTLTINGKLYYEYAGILYQKVETTSGDAYEVTGSYNG